MNPKQFLALTLALLFGLCLSNHATAQSQITGPQQAPAGTLVTFEVTPPQSANWTITSVETTEQVFQADTSTQRLYFATPQQGTYHIVAAIVFDGKPLVLTKTFVNGSGSDIRPLPPVPPAPDTPLAEWVKVQLPLLVKSQNMAAERLLVAQCFDQTIQKIENDTIKTAQNARTQLQIALTMALAFASDTAIDDWQAFLTALSGQMASELGDKINDIEAVTGVFKTVAQAMKRVELAISEESGVRNEDLSSEAECDSCVINSSLQPVLRSNNSAHFSLPPLTPHSTLSQQPQRTLRLFR